MPIKKTFSIIELMTVILIILLLISLIVPTFANVKMQARSALCKSQLRQLGVMINSYQSENGGYLPNDDAFTYTSGYGYKYRSDIPVPKKAGYYDYGPNNNLYSYWNGHLMPYVDVNLPNKYTRHAMVTKIGCTRSNDGQLGSGVQNAPPADVLQYGWAVVDDAFRKGGYNDLKVFICPDIHQNTFDVAASIKFNGVKIPRISQLCTGGVTSFGAFSDTAGYDYGMAGGVPTTYLANMQFFGLNSSYADGYNSFRGDQIAEISKKVLIMEGGVADAFGNGSNGSIGVPYYDGVSSGYYIGGDLSTSGLLYKTNAQFQKLSYVHDNYDTFWAMNVGVFYYYFPSYWMSWDAKRELATKFNAQFAGKAYMAYAGYGGFSLVSFVDPENGKIFNNFFKVNPHGVTLNSFVQFTEEPNDFKYLTGNMNVLFGDGSVATKDQAWLCNNRERIATLSKE